MKHLMGLAAVISLLVACTGDTPEEPEVPSARAAGKERAGERGRGKRGKRSSEPEPTAAVPAEAVPAEAVPPEAEIEAPVVEGEPVDLIPAELDPPKAPLVDGVAVLQGLFTSPASLDLQLCGGGTAGLVDGTAGDLGRRLVEVERGAGAPILATIEVRKEGDVITVTGWQELFVGSDCSRTRPEGLFLALGTEPFWAVRVSGDKLNLSGPSNPEGTDFTHSGAKTEGPVSRWIGKSTEGDGPKKLSLQLEAKPCADSMADALFSHRATVRFGDTTWTGCARKGTGG